MVKRLQLISFFALIATLTLSSCSDNATSVGDKPPPVPPEQSMAMNFSDFETQNSGKLVRTQSVTNFVQAAVRAAVLKGIVDINLAIPRALLAAAANSEARLNEEGQWEWNYNKTEQGNAYGVRLVATGSGSGTVNWQFYVTNSALGLTDKLFFRGTSNVSGTEGSWTYYNLQNSGSEEAVSKITWSLDGENNVDLRLEVVSQQSEYAGDYIEYSFDGTAKTAVHHDASENENITLYWNVNTHAGYLIAPNYNGGAKACWDGNLQDISCSE